MTSTLWKSLQIKDGKIVSGYDESEWQVGIWRKVPPPQEICYGLNACPFIVDAMGYVAMVVLAEVEVDGVTITDGDKITAERMKILRAWRWEKKHSVMLAIKSAEMCLERFEHKYPNDRRPREAIEAAKKWIIDPSDENADAAEDAADAAAKAASEAATMAAMAAEAAALSVEAAARSAARSAACSAEAAALSAEWSAISADRLKMKQDLHNWIISEIVPTLEEIE